MSYSQFFFGNTDHVHGQKFHTRSGAFTRPLLSRDLQDYILETPKNEGYECEQKRQKIKTSKNTKAPKSESELCSLTSNLATWDVS